MLLGRDPCVSQGDDFQTRLQALHSAVVFPAISWCAGTRHWTMLEVRQVRSMQIRSARRIAGWWPHADEYWAATAKRTTRHAEALFRDSKIPPMGRCHRVVTAEVGRPLGPPSRETIPHMVRERRSVVWSVVAEDTLLGLVEAVGPHTTEIQARTPVSGPTTLGRHDPQTCGGWPERRSPLVRGSEVQKCVERNRSKLRSQSEPRFAARDRARAEAEPPRSLVHPLL